MTNQLADIKWSYRLLLAKSVVQHNILIFVRESECAVPTSKYGKISKGSVHFPLLEVVDFGSTFCSSQSNDLVGLFYALQVGNIK